MAYSRRKSDNLYGLDQGITIGAPRPIVTSRAPATNDMAELGSVWVNKVGGTAFICTRVAANVATWGILATPVAAGLAVGTALTVGTTATIGTGLTISAGGITSVGNVGITGSLLASTTVGAGTSIAAGTTITAGTNIVSTLGNITATQGNIVATLGNITATAGNITATLGNITATHGDIVCSTATHGITLPGPIRIITGAGAPAAGLAVNVGDIYIRTDAGGAAERIYICTVAGTFTTVDCAA
jgi:hypothetical protein